MLLVFKLHVHWFINLIWSTSRHTLCHWFLRIIIDGNPWSFKDRVLNLRFFHLVCIFSNSLGILNLYIISSNLCILRHGSEDLLVLELDLKCTDPHKMNKLSSEIERSSMFKILSYFVIIISMHSLKLFEYLLNFFHMTIVLMFTRRFFFILVYVWEFNINHSFWRWVLTWITWRGRLNDNLFVWFLFEPSLAHNCNFNFWFYVSTWIVMRKLKPTILGGWNLLGLINSSHNNLELLFWRIYAEIPLFIWI